MTIALPFPHPAARDAAEAAFGPREAWPASLAFAANICSHNGLPTAVLWGGERRLIHNEGFRALTGGRDAVGRPAAEALGVLWGAFAPATEQVERSGEGAFVREAQVRLPRDGAHHEAFWNLNLLPILDEAGQVRGVLCQANDVSKTVLVERRLTFQIRLADRLRGFSDPEEVKQAATQLLGEYLGAARVGYAEVDEQEGVAWVRSDWTRDPGIRSLAGERAQLSSFGDEALAYLKTGEVLAVPDIHALPLDPAIRSAWEGLGVRSLITVALVVDGEMRALLYVHDPEPRAWQRSDAAIARDVAERTWSAVKRAQAEQSLRDSEDHFRHTVELNPQVTWTATPDGQLNRVSKRWEEWTGTPGTGEGWAEGLHPGDVERTFAAWRHCVATGETYDIEHRVTLRDGSYRWARSRAFPRYRSDGAICLWYGSTEDVHERKLGEERQRLLINELNHRVKNTLATVQAIAFQTLKGDIPLEEARARFEARLLALSRAHNLLTDQNWAGAALDQVVREATDHLPEERFEVTGEAVWLAPRAALALALALHELATNASKYGALSSERGNVRIGWRIEGDRLRFEWKEREGPLVEAPTGRGFGSRLIERGLAADLGGTAEIHFEHDGVRCAIDASLDAVRVPEARS